MLLITGIRSVILLAVVTVENSGGDDDLAHLVFLSVIPRWMEKLSTPD